MKTRITELLGIQYPIIQGGMAWVAEHNLAAAVSNAGGLGIIGAASAPPEIVREEIKKCKELTDKPFGVNVMLLNPNADEVAKIVVEEGVKVVVTIILVIIGLKLISLLRKIVRKSLEKTKLEKGVIQFTDSFIKTVLTIFLFIGVAVNFGLEATSIAALISSVSIAIGLALQGSLSNFAGGLLLLALKPFKVGDYIKEDTHGNEGTVKEISLFYTKLLSYDNKTIVLPNGILANSSMVNYSGDGKRKIDLRFEISYDADIKKTREVVSKILKDNKAIYQS